jgi:hypothetical protein
MDRMTEGTYELVLDVPGIPKHDDAVAQRARESELADPSLVEIPGLGRYANGQTHRVDVVRVIECARMFVNANNRELTLPAGVTLNGKSTVAQGDIVVPPDTVVDPVVLEEGGPSQSEGHPVTSVGTPDTPDKSAPPSTKASTTQRKSGGSSGSGSSAPQNKEEGGE